MSTTVIIGAGIIGVSTAYYLSEHQPGSTIHLVEASPELFSSASGYAGGFLAKDWHAPATASLGALGFELHRLLAEKHGGRERWGYSPTTSISYTARPSSGPRKRGDDWLREGTSRADVAAAVAADDLEGKAPKWLRRVAGDEVEVIGDHDSTAQVDPLALCQFLLGECLGRGVQLHHPATAISIAKDVRDELSSVCIADTKSSTEVDVPATRVIIAAGAWSGQVFSSLFRHSGLKIPVGSLAGHSLVVRSPRWHKELEASGCHAVYTTAAPGYSPEIYARIGGHIYIAGLNSATLPLPEAGGGKAKPREGDIARLKETAADLLGPEVGADDLEGVREGLCFRPVTPSGRPIVARVRDEDLGIGVKTRPGSEGGVFVAAGHGPWGISLGLATGMVLAEMVQGRELSADVGRLGW
ncbi:FAD dependent oxidoreductase [Coniochaeta hoffmannii]|uniref:FAD dependent oxidoreductase n=1 Tax=Coniochaeta hoffmannii TaxID=91930 RepID=A0AA38VC08_9PEZI|nr:FAD dependent oxidoreductase [Coniochaeta hoffmannii]